MALQKPSTKEKWKYVSNVWKCIRIGMVIVFFVRPQNALSSLNYKLEVVWRQNGKKAGIQMTIKWRILRLSSKHEDLFLSSSVLACERSW